MESFDVAIIGAGPGGYVAAIRAAQNGLKVALVEKDARLGGTCLNVGCIPSKALLESSEVFYVAAHEAAAHGVRLAPPELELPTMLARKRTIVEELTAGLALIMKRHKVTVVSGSGRLTGPGRVEVETAQGPRTLEAKHLVLATGSEPTPLADLPFDGRRVVSSTEALSFEAVPPRLAVIGAGAVGLELGSVWRRLGAQVTVIELLPQIVPFADKQLAKALEKSLRDLGLEFRLKTKLVGAELRDDGVTLHLLDAKQQPEMLAADRVLVAVGRRPFAKGLGLEALGVATDERGRVKVNGELQTNVPGVWAIGDLVAGPMLAHKAEEEGIAVADRIAGRPAHINYDAVPAVVYTAPELAQAGLTEDQARERGIDCQAGKFYFQSNGRAKTMGQTDGLVKVVAEAATGKLLGVHIVGPHASDLIAEAALALELGATAQDLARTCHAHPTLAEALKEAALAVDRRSIHG
ncbi:MAG: dihydrolipoyl dehydrogenase [Myxococcales bacterium]|nr:MAG: dihydrolipoyl dehydrogenase [Myxococcales bacterium]